jgi:hypothetical protein
VNFSLQKTEPVNIKVDEIASYLIVNEHVGYHQKVHGSAKRKYERLCQIRDSNPRR